VTELGVEILKLRSEGKSFNQISKLLGCNKSHVSYYCSNGQKEKTLLRNLNLRRERKKHFVRLLGGKCNICGYDKCIGALEFHHQNQAQKDLEPAIVMRRSITNAEAEIRKCILLCANCHREVHEEKSD
jgi:5-methylcytosine-specific restriction endonuclease McrA